MFDILLRSYDVNTQELDGNTAFHLACSTDELTGAPLAAFLRAGADILLQNHAGETILHRFAKLRYNRHTTDHILEALRKHNEHLFQRTVLLRDKSGCSALFHASQHKNQAVANIFMTHYCSVRYAHMLNFILLKSSFYFF